MIEEWLESLHVDLWGDWRISDPERRKLAAEWFERQIVEYNRFAYNAMFEERLAGVRAESNISWDVV